MKHTRPATITILVGAVALALAVAVGLSQAWPKTKEASPPLFSLADVAGRASLIVRGKVLKSRITLEEIANDRTPFQIANVQPSQVLKGNVSSPVIEVRVTTDAESPDIAAGENVILFLVVWRVAQGREYLTPLGLAGKFTVVEDQRYGTIVLNDIELRDWRDTGVVPLAESGRPLRLKEFLKEVQRASRR